VVPVVVPPRRSRQGGVARGQEEADGGERDRRPPQGHGFALGGAPSAPRRRM